MRRMLRARFLLPDYEQYLFMKYQRCVQGSRSVHDYTAEFLKLAERNALNESESQQVARYMKGLKPTIRDKIGMHMVATVDDARSLVLKAERMAQNKGNPYRKNFAESSQTSAERSRVTKPPGLNKQGQGNSDKSAGKKLQSASSTTGRVIDRVIVLGERLLLWWSMRKMLKMCFAILRKRKKERKNIAVRMIMSRHTWFGS
ncbi:hypothetical protein CRG98_004159 [Punica granatum]|uniref:Retrotransposon gag domain-containing protein n=1 Tax=Punica granatum TaxID=22663 RepID=A0A2I0L448_PUNGR|nr:hypothetical protein CRG98_004159 [Punica granatum]